MNNQYDLLRKLAFCVIVCICGVLPCGCRGQKGSDAPTSNMTSPAKTSPINSAGPDVAPTVAPVTTPATPKPRDLNPELTTPPDPKKL